ncbi:hypothetical protein NSQ89_09725 [Niallia sp. FSL R7-0648]|uniref:hypothetical protein n=1 Tax=Niallia TaxID=2837506 RepID=UPI000BA7585D|nr:hypothetical protein [Niallia circulans]MED5099598.1 hypothetical protein [Niallia circulans]PAD27634.1 hypothetical protein CHH62_00820 [Niallia circulans]
MKKVIKILFLPFLFLITACSADPVREDLLEYVNEDMKTAFELEVKAVSAYDSVSGINYMDDWTMYDTIQTTVIPNYNEFIKELNSVQVETEELREIHEIYIEGADTQYNAFVKILTALETQDITLVEEANAMLEEARKLIRQYMNELDKLAKEHEVEWDDSTVSESL